MLATILSDPAAYLFPLVGWLVVRAEQERAARRRQENVLVLLVNGHADLAAHGDLPRRLHDLKEARRHA